MEKDSILAMGKNKALFETQKLGKQKYIIISRYMKIKQIHI